MVKIVVDPDSQSLQERFAIVNMPKRNRKRFAEGCVQIVDNAEQACLLSNPAANQFPAIVYGPSSSSESQRLYYLVRWLS